MKKSMQAIAMVAFFGCWTIMVIAAGKDKMHHPGKCGEAWKKALHGQEENNNGATLKEQKPCEGICSQGPHQEVLLPAQLFHALL